MPLGKGGGGERSKNAKGGSVTFISPAGQRVFYAFGDVFLQLRGNCWGICFQENPGALRAPGNPQNQGTCLGCHRESARIRGASMCVQRNLDTARSC